MYGYTDQPENQKKKIIIVSLIMGIIIIALIGVLIDAIAKKNHLALESGEENKPVDDSAYVVDENGNLVAVSESSETADAEAGKADPVENSESGTFSETVVPSSDVREDTTPTSVPTTSVESIPETGAEGVLGLALLLGSVTTFLLSKSLAKNTAFANPEA